MMIKMMLAVVIVYTVSWLPFNLFLVYGDIWPEDLYVKNSAVASYLFPAFHWLAMAHCVWNPVIYCYMNSRFRDGFRVAISNVPCMWNLFRLCHLRSRNSRQMMDGRRRSYYSTNRLTRTNTTCTTYTFGSGSLHNLHNTMASHYNHAIQHNGNPSVRKHSCLIGVGGNGRTSNASSINVSLYPGKNHPSPPTPAINIPEQRKSGIKVSNTMTSIAPAATSPPSSSHSSCGTGSMVNFCMTPLNTTKNQADLNGPPQMINGQGNGTTRNSSSYVGIVSKGGKEVVTAYVAGSHSSKENEKFLSRKRSSMSISESFM